MMDARGLWPTVRTRDDADATNVRSLELDVAAAAGAAARAVQVTGAYVMVVEPVWVALLAAGWLGETMSATQLAGCALIFGSLLINRAALLRSWARGWF